MLKARIYHPVFYRTNSDQIDRGSGKVDTSIIRIEAQGEEGDRPWKIRDELRPGETYRGHSFEELSELIAAGKCEVDL